ncbi:MAG: sigma 54-interacting transcriptional regulator, partial [Longimicrobiales bacterium]
QALQVKLLRALQDGEIRRVGGTESTVVNVRIISASNQDLAASVRDGLFREDLYYRLAVVPIHLPPLKERREELPDLVLHFIERHRERLGLQIERIHPDALDVLLRYSWPGNIRELENVLEQAMLLSEGDELIAEELPDQVRFSMALGDDLELSDDDLSVKKHSAALERKLIQRALERTGGNRTKAAELLELSSRALRYKILDYGLE